MEAEVRYPYICSKRTNRRTEDSDKHGENRHTAIKQGSLVKESNCFSLVPTDRPTARPTGTLLAEQRGEQDKDSSSYRRMACWFSSATNHLLSRVARTADPARAQLHCADQVPTRELPCCPLPCLWPVFVLTRPQDRSAYAMFSQEAGRGVSGIHIVTIIRPTDWPTQCFVGRETEDRKNRASERATDRPTN